MKDLSIAVKKICMKNRFVSNNCVKLIFDPFFIENGSDFYQLIGLFAKNTAPGSLNRRIYCLLFIALSRAKQEELVWFFFVRKIGLLLVSAVNSKPFHLGSRSQPNWPRRKFIQDTHNSKRRCDRCCVVVSSPSLPLSSSLPLIKFFLLLLALVHSLSFCRFLLRIHPIRNTEHLYLYS